MLSQDKLQTLNQANELLNQKHAKLGLKPMMVSGTSPAMFRAALERRLTQQVVETNKVVREEPSPRIIQIADDYQQTISAIKQPMPKPVKTSYLGLIIVATIIIAAIVLVYSFWAGSKASSVTNSDTIVVSSENRPLIISSGLFAKRADAKAMQAEVERITGDKVRIIKHGPYFTLQIGDSYKSREDAFLVFEELIKYPLRDLALRSSSV